MTAPSKSSSLRPPTRAAVPLFGREADLSAAVAALESGARLLTLTGPAGVGKTRLAHEVAALAPEALGATVLMPRLEGRTETAALEDAVQAAANKAGAAAGDRAIAEQLAALGPVLLVLDPIDPFLGQLEVVGEWLDGCPELSVLLVGRGRSHLAGERILELDVLAEEAAIALFGALAAQQRPGFVVSDGDREAIASIVRTLDRLPLALELAAPRLLVMTPPALLHRLRNRWDVLQKSGGLSRHGTLDQAILWSLELLEPGPRALLAATTVFRGGFTLEVAEAVLTPPPGTSVEAALLHLRERSLLSAELSEDGTGFRLGLLSSVRLLAERELSTADREALEEKHALAYVGAAESWAREVELFGSSSARTQLVVEHQNLAAVVERILGRANVSTRAADRALRVLVALGSVMSREGAGALLRAHLETAIQVAQGSGADPRLLARALALRGVLRIQAGRRAEGERDLGEALVLANHTGDAAIEARVLVASAEHVGPKRRTEARALLERARAMADVSRDRTLLARVALTSALVETGRTPVDAARLATARIALDEARAEAKATGDLALRAHAERGLSRLAMLEGRPNAEKHAAEAVALATTLRDPRGLSLAHAALAVAELARGEIMVAEAAIDAAVEAARQSASPSVLAECAALAALFAFRRGDRGEARALLREAEAGYETLDADLAAAAIVVLDAIAEDSGQPSDTVRLRAILSSSPPADPILAGKLGLPAEGPTLGLGTLFGFGAPPARSKVKGGTLTLARDGSTFALDGSAEVDLSRRKPLRRLLVHIAEQHPGAVAWDALLGVGWPGEKMRADAGAHRVRVAISTLRKMGLSAALETDEDGYRIKRSFEVRLVEV